VLATGSPFGTVGLWDLANGAHVVSFAGHQGPVGALAFAEIDRRLVLATGGDDGAIKIWDPRRGKLLETLTRGTTQNVRPRGDSRGRVVLALGAGRSSAQPDSGPDDVVTGSGRARSVQAIAWRRSSAKPLLASADGDWTARLWEPATDAIDNADSKRSRVGLVRSIATGSAHGYRLIAEGCGDGTTRLREASSGRGLRILELYRRAITTVAFGVVGGRLVVASGGADGAVLVRDAMTGNLLLELDVRTPQARAAYAEAVLLTEIDPGKTVVLTANGYDPIVLWDAQTGERIGNIDRSAGMLKMALGHIENRLVLVSGGRRNNVIVTDLASRTSTALQGLKRTVLALAFTDIGGSPIAATAGTDGAVHVWDLAEAKSIHILPGHKGPIRALGFSGINDRPVLVSGGDDCTVRLWDPGTGEGIGRLADHAAPVTAITTFEDALGHSLVCTAAEDGTHLIQLSAALLKPGKPDDG